MFTLVISGIEVRCERAEDAARLLSMLSPHPKAPREAAPAKKKPRAASVGGGPHAPEPAARMGRRPMFTDDVVQGLHRRYLAGERSAELAQEAGIKLASLYGGWKRLGLQLKRSADAD